LTIRRNIMIIALAVIGGIVLANTALAAITMAF
jgi:hypothetical protein